MQQSVHCPSGGSVSSFLVSYLRWPAINIVACVVKNCKAGPKPGKGNAKPMRTALAVLATALLAGADAFSIAPASFDVQARGTRYAGRPPRMTSGAESEASRPVAQGPPPAVLQLPKAKRNALAANRLQWNIDGVPRRVDSAAAGGAKTEAAAAAASQPVQVERAEEFGDCSHPLGAELEETVRQAASRAAARANMRESSSKGTGEDIASKAAQRQRLQLPGFALASFGFAGRWETAGASYMLSPPPGVAPKAVVHFLGGAFVGAAPHLSYRYLLEDIADAGYIIITTPFNLVFNYVDLCAGLVEDSREAFSRVPAGLPVMGVGHSCGALMHTLLPVLYPQECPRESNVLISWNNKPADAAIPQFESVVVPLVNTLLDDGSEAAQEVRRSISRTLQEADLLATQVAESPLVPLAAEAELLPLTRQGLKVVEQIPELLESVKAGDREFFPTPVSCSRLLRSRYPVPRSLVISFDADSIDESDDVEGLLGQAPGLGNRAAQNRLERRRLTGSHVTPLTQASLYM